MVTVLPSLATVLEALVKGSDVIADDVTVIAVVSVVSNVLEGAVVCVIADVACRVADVVMVAPPVLIEGDVVSSVADVVVEPLLVASPNAVTRLSLCSRPGQRCPAGHHLDVHARTARTPAGVVLIHAPMEGARSPGRQAHVRGEATTMVNGDLRKSCFR